MVKRKVSIIKTTNMNLIIKTIKQSAINIRDNINTKRKLNGSEPIIIYQMGKVGSKSIHLSLKKQGYNNLFHLHSIRHDSESAYSKLLFHHINIERKKAKIITAVREPISRNLSSYFQTIRLFTNNKFDANNYDVDELVKVFFDKYHHVYPLYWFDCEFRNVTGINVYEFEFLNNDYSIIKQGPFDVLILKAESPDELKETAIRKFLNTDDFILKRFNISADKKYSEAYSNFKNSINIPDKYLNEMYSSKYMKHFYTDNEINSLKTKWAENKI